MKYFYIVFYAEQNRNESIFSEKKNDEYEAAYYAETMRVSTEDNLKSRLQNIGGLKAANLCASKKEADEICAMWNDGFKKNGTYLFLKKSVD